MASKFIDKDYLLRCSEKTLQTNEKGFFLQFADHVAEVAGSNWIKNVFGKLQTDKERIRIIYQYKPVKDVVCETLSHVQEIYRKKNAELSQKRRLESEKLLTKGEEPHKALVLSCQSVLRAPEIGENPKVDDGFSLPVAYWNRANILIQLKKYSWALLDVQEALKDNLLDHLKSEAFIKMGVCYKGMGENGRAKIAFGLAERLLEGDEKNLKLIKEYQGRKFTEDKEIDRRVLPKVAGEQHKIYSSASNKINIEEEEGKGRFIAAKEDVQTGDTIIVEEPLVACLLPDNFSTHCHNCLERLVSPVGCKECSSIAFCKIECRDKALSTYHKYECHFSDLLIGSGMSILCHAVLRLITQSTLKECKQMYKNRTKENIFSLCSNSHLRPPEDFLQRTLMAAFLLRCLQKSSYFDDGEANEDVIPNEEEFCVGELLLLYLQVLQFNAHEIYETKCEPEHRFRNSKTVYVGVALYPTAALFNHDCYPSVTRHFVGKKIILTAIRPVKPGEPISENYGPNFTRKTLAERQRSLSSRYWFQCKCFACTQDWPTYDKGLQKLSKRLRCPTSNCTNIFTLPITKEYLKCPRCRKDISLTNHVLEMRTLEQQYEAATNAMEVGDSTKAISLLCQAIDSYHRISYAPHYDTHIGQEIFRACLADTGNTYVSKFFK